MASSGAGTGSPRWKYFNGLFDALIWDFCAVQSSEKKVKLRETDHHCPEIIIKV
jgi:hypothetical protein